MDSKAKLGRVERSKPDKEEKELRVNNGDRVLGTGDEFQVPAGEHLTKHSQTLFSIREVGGGKLASLSLKLYCLFQL